MIDPDDKLRLTAKGTWVWKRAEQLIYQGVPEDKAFEDAINEADTLYTNQHPDDKVTIQ